MLTSQSLLRIAGAALLCTAINACSDSATYEVTESPFCSSMNTLDDSCQYEVGEISFWLVSSHPEMPVENQIQLSLVSQQAFTPEQGEIRGLSMYMGRLPVIWEQTDSDTWQADVMLGACTDPRMLWELIIKKGSHSKRLPFQSVIK